MKLYATARNEKGKQVNLGANTDLTIEINKGNRRMIEFYITLEDYENTEMMVIDMLNLSDGETDRVFDHRFYKPKGESE